MPGLVCFSYDDADYLEDVDLINDLETGLASPSDMVGNSGSGTTDIYYDLFLLLAVSMIIGVILGKGFFR